MVVEMRAERRRPRKRTWIIGGAFLLLIVAAGFSRFYTDVLWFREVEFSEVLWKSLGTQFLVGLVVALVTGAFVWSNLLVAARVRQPLPEVVDRPGSFDYYREILTPYSGWIRTGLSVFVGFMAGISAGSAWQAYLLWANRVPFGVEDPQFGKDIGFYVFELPFLTTVLDWLWFALMASLVLSAAAHFFFNSIKPEPRLSGVSPPALAHLSVLFGLLALVKAAQYWLGTYQLNFSTRGVVTGASYTDVHAQLPALRLLMIIAIVSAVLFLVNIAARRLSLPLAAIGIWLAISILAGGVWPWWVQNFSVKPQELQREEEYIGRNIVATNTAFGTERVEVQPFSASPELSPEELKANRPILNNVRLWSPDLLQIAYQQLQAIRTYYDFSDVDIDRYEIGGEKRQILLSARELELENLPEKTWQNQHLRFTHGYGIVASLANEHTPGGQPEFLVQDIPGTVDPDADSLELEEPRVYFGESFTSDEYSIVNSRQRELDYATEDGTQDYTYQGEGGIRVGGMLNRVAFAIRERDPNLILSRLITADSRVLIYRNVKDRVHRAAPFLALDNDPYPAAIDGRVVWVLDGFTTTSWYPYSQRVDAQDDVSIEGDLGALQGSINYIRNSVKITVDAYDGSMKFYVIDETDPLIQAWRKAFPELFTAGEAPAELEDHFRYPEDLFKVQSQIYLRYHMKVPSEFYAREDEWEIPEDGRGRNEEAEPTYLLTQLPTGTEAEFVLTRPFTPRAKPNMISLMVGRSDPGHYGEMLSLQLPRSRQVNGPGQMHGIINQDPDVSQTRTLLSRAGSEVGFGALIILPIEDSILYVQPMYVSSTTVAIPELKRVIVAFGEDVAMANTFEDALAEMFGLDTGAPGEPTPEPTPGEEPQPTEDLAALLRQASQLYEQAQQALQAGDFAEYGRLIEQLGELLQQADLTSNR